MSSSVCRPSSLRPLRRIYSFTWNSVTPQVRRTSTSNHFISEGPLTITANKDEAATDGDLSTFRLAVKDNIATLSEPTTCASAGLRDYISPFEATVVTQLRRRGAVLVGKTNLDEFGMGSHSTNSAVPKPHEPVAGYPDPERSPGGSSGGSAVAVARGDVDVALGTDTGGSVRLPAAYTGTVGFKPSYGMISRFGVVPYANSLDTVGLLAREVGEIARLLVQEGIWREHDPNDPTSLSDNTRKRCAAVREGYTTSAAQPADIHAFKRLTIGVPLEYNVSELDPAVKQAWITTLTRLESLGARIVPVSLPTTRHALSAYYVIAPAEASSNLAKYDGVRYGARDAARPDGAGEGGVLYSATRGDFFGAEVRRRILLGSYTLSSEAIDNYFVQAQRVRRLVRRDFDRAFALGNPLLAGSDEEEQEQQQQFDLADMPEGVPLDSKLGPAQVDFLVCPTAPTGPPRLEEVVGAEASPLDACLNDVFTVPASLAGLPAVSIPMPAKDLVDGLPVGMQIMGQFWDDARLLGVAETLMNTMHEA